MNQISPRPPLGQKAPKLSSAEIREGKEWKRASRNCPVPSAASLGHRMYIMSLPWVAALLGEIDFSNSQKGNNAATAYQWRQATRWVFVLTSAPQTPCCSRPATCGWTAGQTTKDRAMEHMISGWWIIPSTLIGAVLWALIKWWLT